MTRTANDNKEPTKPLDLKHDEYNALTQEQRHGRMMASRRWHYWDDLQRRAVVTTADVATSFKQLTPIMIEMCPLDSIPAFLEVLISNNVTKWQLKVATKEILRTRGKVLVVAEYFHALDRVKTKLRMKNKDMYDEEALDF